MTIRTPPARTPERAAELVRGVEALIGKLANPDLDIPLPVMDRLERALHLGHRTNLLRMEAVEGRARRSLGITPRLTDHQLDTLRLYAQLGSYEGVADFRGVSVSAVDDTLRLIRVKLGVATSREAIDWLNAEGAVA